MVLFNSRPMDFKLAAEKAQSILWPGSLATRQEMHWQMC
jgi:hypothetical protein